jgi:hypothetical protein
MKRITILLICIYWISCTREEITERNYPRVQTDEITNISNEGAIFKGEITSSNVEIIDHGFTWSNTQSFSIAEQVSLGAKVGKGEFEARVERSMAAGTKYYVYAYAKTKNHVVYGDVKAFVSLGSRAPKILSFAPTKALTLDTIRIAGKYFGGKIAGNLVKFDAYQAKVLDSSDTLIVIIVPPLLNKEKSTISVTVLGNIGNSPSQFELAGPDIQSVSKPSIKPCDTLRINGTYFNKSTTQVFVNLNETKCTVISTSANQIKVLVPLFLPTTPEVSLKVKSSNIERIFANKLIYQKPAVINISPLGNVTFRDTITLNGVFPACEKLKLKIGALEVSPITQNFNQVRIIVPTDLSVSQNTVQLTYGDNSFSYQFSFSLAKPVISGITPSTATFGETVTITGKNFNPILSMNRVTVGGIDALLVSANSREIKIKVSNESAGCSTNGVCNILSLYSAGYSIPSSFALKRPIITTIDPATVSKTGVLTIQGENFSPNLDYNFIKLGNSFFKPSSASASQLTLTITDAILNNGNNFISNSVKPDLQILVGTQSGFNGTGTGSLLSNIIPIAFDYRGPWTRRADYLGPALVNTVNFSIEGKTYIGLGVTSPTRTGGSSSFNSQMWEYNSILDSWRRIKDFPGQPRLGSIAFSIGGKGYVGLGFNSVNLNDIWEYDPVVDSWQRIGDFPGASGERSYFFVINDIAYVGSWTFRPLSKTWQKVSNSIPVTSSLTFTDGTNAYFLNERTSELYRLNVSDNSLTKMASLIPTSQFRDFVVASIDNKGYVFNLASDSFYQYNPTNNNWREFKSIGPFINGTGFVANNRFFYGLGQRVTSITSNGLFNYAPQTTLYELDLTYYPK